MRRVLVDYARSKRRDKRGGGLTRVEVDDSIFKSGNKAQDFEVLHDALNRLSEESPRKSRVVELRFFGGLSVKEAAEVLSVSEETVKLDWRFAKAWLHRELEGRRAP